VCFGRWRVFLCPNVSHHVAPLAGRNQRAYMASIKGRFNLAEVSLGEFLDAYNEGLQAHQKRLEHDRREKEAAEQAAQQKANTAVEAANDWISRVLGPVAANVHKDIASFGRLEMSGTIVREQTGRAPLVVKEVTVALNGGRTVAKLGFEILEDGAILFYRNGVPDTIGSVTTVGDVQIRGIFRDTLRSMSDL
jgi:hypothetical protein